ncbi:MAG: Uma2 family endonuclease, partial [Propionibacteriaceae bacterium]
MAVAAKRDDRMSVPDYRVWVAGRPDDERWELLDGEPVLMSPPTERHQT